MMKRSETIGRWLFLWMLAASSAFAEVSGELETGAELRPFYFRAGAYLLNSSTLARVDGRGGVFGSRLDFEDDLGLDRRKETLLTGFRWRFRDRHFLEFEYFNLKRFGQKRIETEISFRDQVYPVGADLDSSFTTEVTRASYGYRIVRRDDWGLVATGGVHVTRLYARLDGLTFDNVDVPVRSREVASVTAPLPVFGLSGARRLGGKWILVARGQMFFLEVDDVKGAVTHVAAFVEHSTFRNVGFGFGYDWFDIDVDTTDTNWYGRVDVQFQGPMVFIQASF
jgi:hypothetical protein